MAHHTSRLNGLDTMYERLAKYGIQYGDLNVPERYEADRLMGRWVQNMRANYKRVRLEANVAIELLQYPKRLSVETLNAQSKGTGYYYYYYLSLTFFIFLVFVRRLPTTTGKTGARQDYQIRNTWLSMVCVCTQRKF